MKKNIIFLVMSLALSTFLSTSAFAANPVGLPGQNYGAPAQNSSVGLPVGLPAQNYGAPTNVSNPGFVVGLPPQNYGSKVNTSSANPVGLPGVVPANGNVSSGSGSGISPTVTILGSLSAMAIFVTLFSYKF